MDPAAQRFKGDVWQVLAHLLAINLLWVAALTLLAGLALAVLLPGRRLGRDAMIGAFATAVLAFLLQAYSWV